MKVVPPKNDGPSKKKPLLPLVPEPEEELTASNSVSYLQKVREDPNRQRICSCRIDLVR